MKTVIFIPARLGSTRLPAKALVKIDGKSAIEYLIDRLKLSKKAGEIVLCTTTKKEDDVLVKVAERCGISFFRGSENDILDRFLNAAKKYGADFVVNVDGDDILCDPELVDETIECYAKEQEKPDFIKWVNLPLGISPVGIKVEALEKVCRIKDTAKTDTGWGKYFTDTEDFSVKELRKDGVRYNRPDIRLTLDYPEDLQLISEVIKRLGKNGPDFSLSDIIRLFETRPELLKINERVAQEYWERFNKLSEIKIKKA